MLLFWQKYSAAAIAVAACTLAVGGISASAAESNTDRLCGDGVTYNKK